MATQTFLIVGATGTQGSSVITALLSAPSAPSIRILALTRNTSSSKAKSLAASDPRIGLVSGDPTSPEEIFAATGTQIDAVFCVTIHGPPGAEEAQANGLIDASLRHGVKHFVFTSADRGGEVLSDTNPTPVPHIATKHRIELYLKEKTIGTPMSWTILRPVTFMDNLTPDFPGKGFAAMWRQVGKRRIQVVAASDIGAFAAKALLEPEKYAGKSLGIAGDELNFEEACEIFKQALGVEMPTTFCTVGSVLKVAMKDIGSMFKWFETAGYAVDIKGAREIYPDLQDFSTWLKKSSAFRYTVRTLKSRKPVASKLTPLAKKYSMKSHLNAHIEVEEDENEIQVVDDAEVGSVKDMDIEIDMDRNIGVIESRTVTQGRNDGRQAPDDNAHKNSSEKEASQPMKRRRGRSSKAKRNVLQLYYASGRKRFKPGRPIVEALLTHWKGFDNVSGLTWEPEAMMRGDALELVEECICKLYNILTSAECNEPGQLSLRFQATFKRFPGVVTPLSGF
ncbi:hypothetical protein G7Y89_g4088 [Cudoniella acicularis]|uniref:NmrA-like domain-containing protein n=1 Tax=Cudoniella acicularis TaxID=354080 RepID=A0A8H4RQY5_9HELO|nr:hypothetical protein G7Y89_g4088 [Cudoniella acicularis]